MASPQTKQTPQTKQQPDQSCLFCSFADHSIPAHTIAENETHMAFLTIFPNTEGFTVVIPKKHLPSDAFSNTDKDLAELIAFTKTVAQQLVRTFPDVGRCGMFFEGYGIDHLHSKVFPMHGTGHLTDWKQIESKEPVFYEEYPGFLSSQEGERVEDSTLAKLADRIRQHA